MGGAHPGNDWLLWAGCVLFLGAGCRYSVRRTLDDPPVRSLTARYC